MAVHTLNNYGKITISNEAIANVAGYFALECYGVVDLVPRRFSDNIAELFKRGRYGRGVKVSSHGNKISLDISVILKYGVSINAVADSLKKSVKYNVEDFTGMIVESINVNIMGVKVWLCMPSFACVLQVFGGYND